jgi:hypothetical protein
MTGQHKRYRAEPKTRIALESIRGHKTANEIAAEYGGHLHGASGRHRPPAGHQYVGHGEFRGLGDALRLMREGAGQSVTSVNFFIWVL